MLGTETIPTAKDRVREKLAKAGGDSVSKDLKDALIRNTINSVEKTDGKITANFSVDGIPTGKENMHSYRTIPKIFDTWEQFSEYANNFFNMSDEEIIELCKKEKSKIY